MSNNIASDICGYVIDNTKPSEIEGQTPEKFWSAIREYSAKIREDGHDPILVINSMTEPKWLIDWISPYSPNGVPKPADLVIRIDEDQVEGYQFTINDIPVYQAGTTYGVVYLISEQMMHQLRYHNYNNNLPVSLQFKEHPNNPLYGTMHASFQYKVELKGAKAYQIKWSDSPNVSE